MTLRRFCMGTWGRGWLSVDGDGWSASGCSDWSRGVCSWSSTVPVPGVAHGVSSRAIVSEGDWAAINSEDVVRVDSAARAKIRWGNGF